jgi:hypothetical protein
MNWARRIKRVFGVDIESYTRCGGKLKVIASIEGCPLERGARRSNPA